MLQGKDAEGDESHGTWPSGELVSQPKPESPALGVSHCSAEGPGSLCGSTGQPRGRVPKQHFSFAD